MAGKLDIINKYNLTLSSISKLKINRKKLSRLVVQEEQNLLWRNNVIDAWCLNGTLGYPWAMDSYWLGIYDEAAEKYPNKVRVNCTALNDVPDLNYENQKQFIEKLNILLDEGILY